VRDNVWGHLRLVQGPDGVHDLLHPSLGLRPEGLAGKAKIAKEGDLFEGSLDGAKEKGRSPFKPTQEGRNQVEGKTYRGSSILLVNPAGKEKVVMVQGVGFGPAPKDPEEWAVHAENEARRIAKDPKIADFPPRRSPRPTKPDTKKKK
jgi:hypothetical protein